MRRTSPKAIRRKRLRCFRSAAFCCEAGLGGELHAPNQGSAKGAVHVELLIYTDSLKFIGSDKSLVLSIRHHVGFRIVIVLGLSRAVVPGHRVGRAAENRTGSAHGGYASMSTTPTGTSTLTETNRFQANGGRIPWPAISWPRKARSLRFTPWQPARVCLQHGRNRSLHQDSDCRNDGHCYSHG
jgi:hypothetical protein